MSRYQEHVATFKPSLNLLSYDGNPDVDLTCEARLTDYSGYVTGTVT